MISLEEKYWKSKQCISWWQILLCLWCIDTHNRQKLNLWRIRAVFKFLNNPSIDAYQMLPTLANSPSLHKKDLNTDHFIIVSIQDIWNISNILAQVYVILFAGLGLDASPQKRKLITPQTNVSSMLIGSGRWGKWTWFISCNSDAA